MATNSARGPLEGFFQYRERGSRLSDEIVAGLGMCVLAVCGMFMNMQLVAGIQMSGAYAEASQAQVAANGEIIALTWFVSMVVAFAGSLVIGLVARLPLTQVTSLGLSSVLISLMGTAQGLTYYNVLFLSLLGSAGYAVLMGVAPLRRLVFRALPDPVRKALPAAAGLLIAFVALQLSGLVSMNGTALASYGTGHILESASDSVVMPSVVSWSDLGAGIDKYYPTLLLNAGAVVLAFVVFLVAKRRSRHPFGCALAVATVAFLVLSVLMVCVNWKGMRFSIDSLWARLWMAGSEDAMQFHLPVILSSLAPGKVLSEGSDFSAYVASGGNVILLVVGTVATFMLVSFADAVSTVDAVCGSMRGGADPDGPDARKALVVNAATAVVAPLVGASPVGIAKESYAAAEDHARTGLASVVASLGFLVSAFVWVVPFFFVTVNSYDITFNMVGHYGFVLQLLTECSFAVADAVMVLVGLNMAVGSLSLEWRKFSVASAFLGTVAGTVFTGNLALGVACGTFAYVVAEASRKGKALERLGEEPSALKRIGVPTLVLFVVSVLVIGVNLFL